MPVSQNHGFFFASTYLLEQVCHDVYARTWYFDLAHVTHRFLCNHTANSAPAVHTGHVRVCQNDPSVVFEGTPTHH